MSSLVTYTLFENLFYYIFFYKILKCFKILIMTILIYNHVTAQTNFKFKYLEMHLHSLRDIYMNRRVHR